jgi:hypothetical protein
MEVKILLSLAYTRMLSFLMYLALSLIIYYIFVYPFES